MSPKTAYFKASAGLSPAETLPFSLRSDNVSSDTILNRIWTNSEGQNTQADRWQRSPFYSEFLVGVKRFLQALSGGSQLRDFLLNVAHRAVQSGRVFHVFQSIGSLHPAVIPFSGASK